MNNSQNRNNFIISATHLGHYNILAFLDELVLGFDDGLQELQVLHVPAVALDAVDEVLHDPLVHLTAQLKVVHEYVLHRDGLQDLQKIKSDICRWNNHLKTNTVATSCLFKHLRKEDFHSNWAKCSVWCWNPIFKDCGFQFAQDKLTLWHYDQ